jgi:hypothetical protein
MRQCVGVEQCFLHPPTSGIDFKQKFLLTSDKEVQWQRVVNARLIDMSLYRPVSILNEAIEIQDHWKHFCGQIKWYKRLLLAVQCQKKYLDHWVAGKQGNYSWHLGILNEPKLPFTWEKEFLVTALFHRREPGNALSASASHMPSLFVEYYSSTASSYAQPKWIVAILPTDALLLKLVLLRRYHGKLLHWQF